jgi:predicted nucleic acid-binding protein
MSSLETPIEPLYVVDTHALIWYLTDDTKLGERAAQVFAAAEQGETRLVVPAIVVAELYYANKKHSWFVDFKQTYEMLKAVPYLRFVPFVADHVLDFDRDRSVPEMHDRMIVGLANRLGAPLLTMDPQIGASELVPIVW